MTAEVDREVTLPCRTTLETPVDWYYQKSENETAEFVSSGGEITDDFSTRFDLERSTFGDFSLIIHNVTKADEGVFTCLEDAGQGTEHRITLSVTGKITQHAFILLAASTAAEGGLMFCLRVLFIYFIFLTISVRPIVSTSTGPIFAKFCGVDDIHRESKKQDTKLLAITSTIILFSNFLSSGLSSKFATNSCLNIPPRFKHVKYECQKNGIILKYVLQLMMNHKVL